MSEEGIEVRLGPPAEPEFLRSIYANQINVNFTPHDFRLTFSLMEVPLAPPDRNEINPTAVASVIVPATVMYAFIGVLRDQFDRYIQSYGAPGMSPEGPRGGGQKQ